MNKKQFKRFLEAWDEAILNTHTRSAQREVLTSFLKRLQRANARQELQVIKVCDNVTENGRHTEFLDKKTGVKFEVYKNYNTRLIYLSY